MMELGLPLFSFWPASLFSLCSSPHTPADISQQNITELTITNINKHTQVAQGQGGCCFQFLKKTKMYYKE